MDSHSGKVFKGLLNEFSNKPYISMSHNVYPIDPSEEGVQSVTPPLSDVSATSSEEIKDEPSLISLKPKKGQLDEVAKLNIFINLSPQDFLEVKKQFSFYDDGVSVTQFVLIILDILTTSVSINEKNLEFIRAVILLYQMVDVYSYNRITFDQLSNFLVEMHEILDRDQSLFEIRFKPKSIDQLFNPVPIEKLFDLTGYNGFAYLDQGQKTLRVVNPLTWDEILNVSIGSTTIVSAYYLKKRNCLIISSNDRFLNFFDMHTHKLQRRFIVPDVQTFIQYSNRKGLIYTGAVNGTMYCWDLEKIYTKEFLKNMSKFPDCFKLVMVGEPINNHESSNDRQVEKSMASMLLIEALEIMATGSSDTLIRLFENKRKLTSQHKELRGHQKAIKALGYCAQFKYLISCSYDFDVLIWNIYLDHPLAKLVGHEAPLLSILTIQEKKPHKFSLIMTCDAKGVLRVWDPKTFQTVQVFTVGEGEQRVKSLIYKRESSMVMLGHKKLQLYEIDQTFDANVTDDNQIISMCYSKRYSELHLGGQTFIKSWDLQNGKIKRIFKDISEGYLTTMCLDSTERRAFIGLHTGLILMLDIITGFKIRVFKDFTKEVCFLGYSGEYHLLVSASWDKQIRIYKDFNEMNKKPDKDLSLRIIKNAHQQELTLAQFSQDLMLIATTTREGDLRLWDFEKGNFVGKLRNTSKEILALKFLEPFPLIVAADSSGTLCVNILRPHKLEMQVAIVWKNMFTIMKAAQVTCLDHLSSGPQNLIIAIGDENGDIRVLDLCEVIQQIGVTEINFKEMAANKNMHRFFQLNFQEYENQPEKPVTDGIVNEKSARQTNSWKAHKQGLKSICIVKESNVPTLISLAADRLVKLWNLKGTLLGVLKQGAQEEPLRLSFSTDYKTEIQRIESEVLRDFDKAKNFKDKLRRAKTVPFKKEEQEFGTLGHVESREIFKDLQEIGRYLDKKHEQDKKQEQEQKQRHR